MLTLMIKIGEFVSSNINTITILKIINRCYFIINCTSFQFTSYKFRNKRELIRYE